MPTPRLEFYSSEWFNLISIVSSGKEVKVELDSITAARNLRYRFYNFRKQLRKSEEHKDDIAFADLIIATIHDVDGNRIDKGKPLGPGFVYFRNRELSDEAQTLRAMVPIEGESLPEQPGEIKATEESFSYTELLKR